MAGTTGSVFKQNLTNHVSIVLDRSWSMDGLQKAVIDVTDGLVTDLAGLSERMRQETRVSIYLLGDDVQCVVWDMDVLRLPSIRDLYVIGGNTALCTATMRALRDHEQIPEQYGDHAFLHFVLTDGQENQSTYDDRIALPGRLERLRHNESVAILVPGSRDILHAQSHGFPRGSIERWDATSRRGVEEAASKIGTAVENWMTGRETGTRSTLNVFDTSAARVNAQTVKAALTPLDATKFRIFPVSDDSQMDEIMAAHGLRYVNGSCFYELHKSEKINSKKDVIVVEKATDIAYGGDGARDLIGLPPRNSGTDVVVPKPKTNDKYVIYVQSTAGNRKPRAGHHALVMLDRQPALA